MKRLCSLFLLTPFLLPSCKTEVKEYTATLDARCYDCIVQYAAGADRGIRDTLTGSVNAATGDTFTEAGQYRLVMREGEEIFFRACRMRPDSAAFGDIVLNVSGDVQPLSTTVDRDSECAVISQPVQFK